MIRGRIRTACEAEWLTENTFTLGSDRIGPVIRSVETGICKRAINRCRSTTYNKTQNYYIINLFQITRLHVTETLIINKYLHTDQHLN